jgi:hypothetical protein
MRRISRAAARFCFFDQKFGLLVYARSISRRIGGAGIMVRRGDLRYLGIVCSRLGRWRSSGAPRGCTCGGVGRARRRVSLRAADPCLAPMIAVAVRIARFAWARPLFAVCAIVSIGVAFMAAILPERRLVYSDPHAYARLLVGCAGGSPLAATFPTFTVPDWWTPFIAVAALVRRRRPRPGDSRVRFASFQNLTWRPPF